MEEKGRPEKSFIERLIDEQVEKRKNIKGIVVKEIEGEEREKVERDSKYFEYSKHGNVVTERRPTE